MFNLFLLDASLALARANLRDRNQTHSPQARNICAAQAAIMAEHRRFFAGLVKRLRAGLQVRRNTRA